MSMAIVCQTSSGGGIGFNGALFAPTAFLLAQISHLRTYSLISFAPYDFSQVNEILRKKEELKEEDVIINKL